MSDQIIHAPDDAHVFTAYGSNAFRLALRQWLVVLAIVVPFVVFTPKIWRRAEKLKAGIDFRMNYELSNDYWLYGNYAKIMAARCDTLVVGDSVIWGPYVTPEQTLSHYLNEQAGGERFANLGLNGAHPVALAGLLEHYGPAIAGKNVILLCNALWMSSPERDLQVDEGRGFNHPKLVPQFSPWIKGYKEELSPRIGVVVERNLDFKSWASHVQQAYFDQKDVPSWTIDHPYESPLRQLTFVPPPDDGKPRQEPLAWTEQGMKPASFPFVELSTSLQWQAFKRAAEVLQQRGNRVVVVINPLNEHMLTPGSREVYTKLRQQMSDELRAGQIECIVPALLPSEEYADASHPLSEGYKRLAKELYEKLK